MPSLAAQITAAGISAPGYDDTLAQLKNGAMGIYGSDIALTPDTQDAQYLSIFAQAIADANQTVIAVYNSFSPAFAQGTGLSSLVKINGLKRAVPSYSQEVVTIVGQAGITITNGVIGDNLNLNTTWALPASVTIPDAGTINVTATCQQPGAVPAANNSLTNILTPTLGWQSVTNGANAVSSGNPVESDSALRQRQTISTANPSQTVLQGIVGSLAALPGVSRLFVYENDTGAADGNGLPAHSIAAVVAGGDTNQIANAISIKKAPGTATYGTTSVVVIDANGVPNTINYYPLTSVPLTLSITLTPLLGYVSTTKVLIQAAVANFINGLAIGQTSYLNRLWAPANLSGDNAMAATGMTQAQLDLLSSTYNVTAILQSRAGPPAAGDVAIAFNEAATSVVGNITIAP